MVASRIILAASVLQVLGLDSLRPVVGGCEHPRAVHEVMKSGKQAWTTSGPDHSSATIPVPYLNRFISRASVLFIQEHPSAPTTPCQIAAMQRPWDHELYHFQRHLWITSTVSSSTKLQTNCPKPADQVSKDSSWTKENLQDGAVERGGGGVQ